MERAKTFRVLLANAQVLGLCVIGFRDFYAYLRLFAAQIWKKRIKTESEGINFSVKAKGYCEGLKEEYLLGVKSNFQVLLSGMPLGKYVDAHHPPLRFR